MAQQAIDAYGTHLIPTSGSGAHSDVSVAAMHAEDLSHARSLAAQGATNAYASEGQLWYPDEVGIGGTLVAPRMTAEEMAAIDAQNVPLMMDPAIRLPSFRYTSTIETSSRRIGGSITSY